MTTELPMHDLDYADGMALISDLMDVWEKCCTYADTYTHTLTHICTDKFHTQQITAQ